MTTFTNKRFLKGNLHMHTTRSDGRLTPEQAIALYRRNGYDFVCLTDHWMPSEQSEHMGMTVLSGVELDAMGGGLCVHIVGAGLLPGAEFQRGLDPQGMIDAIREAGGRAILCHPAWSLNTPETVCSLRGLSAAEIYNTLSGEPWNNERADSSLILDLAMAAGARLNLVATDDAHHYTGENCASCVMVAAPENTREAILSALDRGDFYATQGPAFHSIELEDGILRVRCTPVRRVSFYSNRVWAADRCQSGDALTAANYRAGLDDERFVRVVITDTFGRKAWSNPVWL